MYRDLWFPTSPKQERWEIWETLDPLQDIRNQLLRTFCGQLVQQISGCGEVVYPEDHQRQRRSCSIPQ